MEWHTIARAMIPTNTGSTCKETLRKLHPSLLSIYIINASKRVSFL